jgi:hypothetical protein
MNFDTREWRRLNKRQGEERESREEKRGRLRWMRPEVKLGKPV